MEAGTPLVVLPASNTTLLPELAALTPGWDTPLVAPVPNPAGGLSAATLPDYQDATMAVAAPFRTARPRLVAYGCTAAGFLGGPSGNAALVRRLSDALEAPVVSTADAMVQALLHHGARRVAVLTPYLKPANDGLAAYLEQSGVAVVRLDSFLCPDVAALCAVTAAQVLARGAAMDLSGCDALFVACTQLPTLAALPPLRKRLGVPVWSANSATAWMLARHAA